MHLQSASSSRKNQRSLRLGQLRALCLVGFLLVLAAVLPHIPLSRRASAQGSESTAKQRGPAFVPGEILVRFRKDADATKSAARASVVVREGMREISVAVERFEGSELISGLRVAHVDAEDTLDAIAALNAREDVIYAEPNYLMYKDAVPDDPQYRNREMYALNNTGQFGGVAGADIDAELAWNVTTGSSNVVVGVIDSGIDITHPDLQLNIWTNAGEIPNNGIDDDANGFVDDVNGWDFYNNDNTVFDSASIDGHGTHVAGTIGAVGNNGRGAVGVNWQVKIMPLKFLGSSSGDGPTSAAISAINYAKQMAARGVDIRVLNNSWGGGNKSQALLDAIAALSASGILFVASAGNNGTDNFSFPHYPSNYDLPNLISVASTNRYDLISDFSSFGARNVTLGAPGSDIVSTMPNNTYIPSSGTSMATPHVSGAAALILSAKPNTSLQELSGSLRYSGDVITSLEGKTRTGRRLNVYKSILSAQENDTTAPSVPAGFSATPIGGRALSLAWSAPGDDGVMGTAANYDVFFISSSPGAQRFLLPSQVVPGVAGTQQGTTVVVPYRNTSGTITFRTYDNVGNFSDATAAVNLSLDSTDPFSVALGSGGGLSTGGDKLLNPDNSTIFQGDDRYRPNHILPFEFPYFGQWYNQLAVSSNGTLYFTRTLPGGISNDADSSIAGFQGLSMIAGMWDDLIIDTAARPTDGIYIVRPNANTIVFRWQGATFDEPVPINFEIELSSGGGIVFRYGEGNTGLSPVVGISSGEPEAYIVESHTSETTPKSLANAASVTFSPRVIPTPIPTPTPTPLPSGVRKVSLATKDLVYDPGTLRIYASVPSSAGVIGNSITAIDPFAGTVGSSVVIGSEPGKLAISDDHQYIYASLDGSASVRRFDIASQTPGLQFALGSEPRFNSPYYVEDMAVVPGRPDSVAVSRKYLGTSTKHAGVAVYDGGTQRPTATGDHTLINAIEFSSSESTLYGYNNESTEFGLRELSITNSGVSVISTTTELIIGFGVDIRYDNGLIYSTNGRVVNPQTRTLVGTLPGAGFGLVLPDSTVGRVYFLTGSGSTLTLKAYDQMTLAQAGSLTITGVSGTPESLIKWGTEGLAFRTNDQVYLIQPSLIPAIASNPVDDARNFIRQHYLDFLGREPDQGGWDYWTSQITACGTDAACVHRRRIDVSAAFFVELEFQRTGYVVYRLYRAAYDPMPNTTTRANVSYAQFNSDRAQLVDGAGLEQSTINLANAFVQRPEFLQAYSNSLTNAQFVNQLFDTAQLAPYTTERQQQIDAMNNSGKTRAQVLLDVVETAEFKTREYNLAFVLMQYFGYLRRDPDQAGYDFWLDVLNNRVPNNFRGMVCAFLTSAEYQQRFGAAITRTDQDCSQ